MPFGRYKGRPIPHLPRDYRQTLLDKVKLSVQLRAEIEASLRPPAGRYLRGKFIPDWLLE
jgi:hypothetical protein